MSLPPKVIQVKRKRHEEPVGRLYIKDPDASDANKRVRTDDFVFRLISKSIDIGARQTHPRNGSPRPGPNVSQSDDTGNGPVSHEGSDIQTQTRPRHFHLTRSLLPGISKQSARKGGHGRSDIATLVERRSRENLNMGRSFAVPTASIPADSSITAATDGAAAPTLSASSQQSFTTHKGPTKKPPGGNRYGQPRLPPARRRFHSISKEKQASFEQWAQEEEKSTSIVMSESTASDLLTELVSPINARAATNTNGGVQENSLAPNADRMDLDDGEYVYDTYVRYTTQDTASDLSLLQVRDSANTLNLLAESELEAVGVGYLVISDEDIELWETYASDPEETDDKDDWDSEQDDENAENYYGADYPEDEVSSGDENGTGTYRYRTRHAGVSDEEEYDLVNGSSEEDENNQNPWRQQEAARTGVYQMGVGELTRHQLTKQRANHMDNSGDEYEG